MDPDADGVLMTAPGARRFAAQEEAVSAVVSAALLFTLFSTAFFVWTIDTLPEWIADREQNHAQASAGAFSRAVAELDAVQVGDSATVNLDLSPARVPLLQIAAASSQLSVEEGFRFTAAYSGEQVFMLGRAMVAAPEATLPETFGIATVRALEFTFTGPGNNQAGFGELTAFRDDDEDGVVDAGEPSVQARLGIRSGAATVLCGNSEVYLEVRTGSGPSPALVATHAIACDPDTGASFGINLLAQEYRFSGLLGRLGDGFSMTSRTSGAGTPGVAMVWTGTDGATRATGSGVSLDADNDLDGDRLVLAAGYQQAPPRVLTLEGGGVVNIEDQGAAFVQTPEFTAVKDAGEGYLRWHVLDLSGDGSIAGTDAARLRFTKLAVSETLLRVPAGGATFTVETQAAGAWQQLWTNARVLGGFDAADMVTGTGAGTATLNLGSIPWTVHLTIVHADVSVT